MNDSKNHRKDLEDKFNKYKKEILNEKLFLFKINQMFRDVFEEIFDDILIIDENQFISQLKNKVEEELEEIYSDKISTERRFSNVLEKGLNIIKNDYKVNFDTLNNTYYLFSKNNNTKRKNIEFLVNQYRRHCLNEVENEHATHTCDPKFGKFILVKKYGKTEFVICSHCKKVYYSNMILCKCYKCNKEYFTEILSKNEDEFLLPATWDNYHCKQIANEKIKCIKCHENFYINMKTGMLVCLNKKCNFSSKPLRILWTCSICQEEFKSGAIPYNSLDLIIIKRIIKQTLFLKQKAHPYKVPCCKINVFFTEFYHKKKCSGILYNGELNGDIIIVCNKCHAINFYDRFIWTCPKCGNKFKDEKEEKDFSVSENTTSLIRSSTNTYSTISTEGIQKKDSNIICKDCSNFDEEYFSHSNTSKNRGIITGSIKKPYLSNQNEDINIKRTYLSSKKETINIKGLYLSNKKEINNNINNNKENNKYQNKEKINESNSEKYSATIEQPHPRSFKKLYSSRFDRKIQIIDNNNKVKKTEDKIIEKKSEDKIGDKKENDDELSVKNKSKRLKVFSVFENNKKEKEKDKDKDKEEIKEKENEKVGKENNNKQDSERKLNNSNVLEDRRKVEKATFNVFAKYRQRRRMEEKERKEREENEERKRKEEKEREEKEREEKERVEKEREEKEKKEEKRVEKIREKELRKEKEEKEKKKNNEEIIFAQSSKRLGCFKIFKRPFVRKENNENIEFSSSKGLEKVQKKENQKNSLFAFDTKKSEENELKNEKNMEEEEEIEEDDTKIKSKNKDSKEDSQNVDNKDEKTPSFRYRWKFRRPEAKKTLGKVIKEEVESTNITNDNNTSKIDNNSNEENTNVNYHENNIHKNYNQNINTLINPVTKIPGISDNLLNHLNRRISNIISKCSIPLMNVEDYILYRKIGEGSYGIIFSVINKKDKKQYALKKIISNKLKQIGEFTKEFELVHSCKHENIMKIYHFCIRILDPTTYALYVLMELSDGDWDKEIKKKLKQRKNYSESELISILYQLTSALQYIQEKFHISHRDIKPQNILVFSDGKYKLADFGEAKETKVSRQINTLRGTELYMSPALYEGLKNERNDVTHNPFKSDVFSLGFCFLYASALNFNLLYEIRDILDSRTINVILHKFLNKFYSEKLIQLLASMLEIDEGKRYDFSTIKKYIENNYPEISIKDN